MSGPRWLRSERFERKRVFEVHGSPADLFPLLCPVREYEWLPGWRCRMGYSQSGVAERDAVFTTSHLFGAKSVVWTCITYEPDSLVEYLMVSGRDGVVRLSIGLEAAEEGRTRVSWGMLFTATTRIGARLGRHQFSESAFAKMIDERKRELDHFLTTGTMLAGGGARSVSHF